jgi:hypothetical protein
MNDYKSVQDLIVKAAFYDGVTTTIEANGDGMCALKITFSKNNRHATTLIDMNDGFRDHEFMALYCCKDALHKLLWGIYDEIKVKEN